MRPDVDLGMLHALPRDDTGPVFEAPWQAEAFAMTLALHEAGLFRWREWADGLAVELAAAALRGAPDDGSHYYEHWLAALERLVAEKSIVPEHELARRIDEWGRRRAGDTAWRADRVDAAVKRSRRASPATASVGRP